MQVGVPREQEVGATILEDHGQLYACSQIVVCVQGPGVGDAPRLQQESVVMGFVQPLLALDLVNQLRRRGGGRRPEAWHEHRLRRHRERTLRQPEDAYAVR